MANHVDGLDEIDMEYTLDAWGDVPPLTGHTLFAEAATEKQRADLANMTLATLCDMVLGEDAADRSDDALVRAVGELERERDAAQGALEFAQRYWMDAIAERDAANKRAKEYVGVFKRVNAAKRVWRKRAEQAEADARALAARVFDTELITDDELDSTQYLEQKQ